MFGAVVGGAGHRVRARPAAQRSALDQLLAVARPGRRCSAAASPCSCCAGEGVQLFVSYLAVANLFFLGSFLFLSPTSELVAGGGPVDIGDVVVPPLAGPVVVVVLDELPAATIMRARRLAQRRALPRLRRAGVGEHVVPQRLQPVQPHPPSRARRSSRVALADRDDLPTAADHPRNLFSLLGHDVPVRRYESVTDMCPTDVCAPPPRQPLSQAIEDASVVYGHRVLPSTLRDELPSIDNSWGAYGEQDDGADDWLVAQVKAADDDGDSLVDRAYARWRGLDADEKSPLGQAGVLRDEIAAITGEPALHFVHVALPAPAVGAVAAGRRTSYAPELITDPDAPGYDFAARQEYQLHSMQVGAADTLVGELVDHLRATPQWEDTLLVVTSDHGTNLTPPNIGRMKVTEANREEVYRVPAVRQGAGSDRRARSTTTAPRTSTCCRRSSTCSTPRSTGSSTATRCTTAAPPTPSRRWPRTSTAALDIADAAGRGVPARRRLDGARRRRRARRPRRHAGRRPRASVTVAGWQARLAQADAARRPADRRR